MNALLLWFHRTGSPPNFDRFTARWTPWCFGLAIALLLVGTWGALFEVPADYKQGEVFRILYIHVPAAWSAMFIFVAMAVQAFIALVWRIKACETLAVASAPVGAIFAAITLITGSIWGRPTWGTWWEWDPRLTSMLVMFFLYLGVIALHNAIEDRRAAARAACFLALVGVVNVPVVHFSVHWWNSLHQGETIQILSAESRMHYSMLWPLLFTALATKFWYVGSLLQRARVLNLENESAQPWARELAAGSR
ncbi:MAG: heme ABC transporter permease CcmC [Xanthomonadaceae bacterium]|jgi:heme exporter protein C|nr:heme ABC transporter permease CcmC [Xanthomonadaceae bacterium]